MKPLSLKLFLDYTFLVFNDEAYYTDAGSFYSQFNWGRLVLSLAPNLKKVLYAVPVRSKTCEDDGIKIESDRVIFVSLPFWNSLISSVVVSIKSFRRINSIIKNATKHSEVVFIRLPSIVAFFFFFWAKILKKPLVIYIGGNIITQANPSISGTRVKKLTSRLTAFSIHLLTKIMVRYSLVTFVKGNELLRMYRNKISPVVPYITSQISNSLIREAPDDTCQKDVVRIIRVAQILQSKGLEFLIGAISMLKKDGYSVHLDIVGKANNARYGLELKKLVKESGLEKDITFHGYVPFGKELFDLYKDADISVISSLSEGSPRTIIESFAFGLPLVGTIVGGIPDVVTDEDNGLLVPPKSSEHIYKAILRIIEDQILRRKLIRNGRMFAKDHTEEVQAEMMLKTIEKYLGK